MRTTSRHPHRCRVPAQSPNPFGGNDDRRPAAPGSVGLRSFPAARGHAGNRLGTAGSRISSPVGYCSRMTATLKRVVSTPLLYFFILGDVLGAGVYVLVGESAGASGGAVWLPLLAALVLACLTAGSYAELATRFPRAGGSAHYVTLALGPAAGSFIGFCMLAA